jgi:hypothetical protein
MIIIFQKSGRVNKSFLISPEILLLHDLHTKQGYPIYRKMFFKAFFLNEKLQSSNTILFYFPAPKIFLNYYKITIKKKRYSRQSEK